MDHLQCTYVSFFRASAFKAHIQNMVTCSSAVAYSLQYQMIYLTKCDMIWYRKIGSNVLYFEVGSIFLGRFSSD